MRGCAAHRDSTSSREVATADSATTALASASDGAMQASSAPFEVLPVDELARAERVRRVRALIEERIVLHQELIGRVVVGAQAEDDAGEA